MEMKNNNIENVEKNDKYSSGGEKINFISPKKVCIFAYSYCPYSNKAAELLSNLNIEADIIYIDKHPELKINKDFKKALDKHSGTDIYPKVYIGLSCVGSYRDLYDLFTQNKLFDILKSEGIEYMEDDYY
jgi:glutaredoxin